MLRTPRYETDEYEPARVHISIILCGVEPVEQNSTNEIGGSRQHALQFRQTMAVVVGAAAARSKALSLYRQLLRGAAKMPTPNRRKFVIKKTRSEFKASKHLTDPSDIEFCLRLADTNLDTVLIQAEHLTRLMKDPSYHADL